MQATPPDEAVFAKDGGPRIKHTQQYDLLQYLIFRPLFHSRERQIDAYCHPVKERKTERVVFQSFYFSAQSLLLQGSPVLTG